MNQRAQAYLRRYQKLVKVNGKQELMLPLERLQGFLDLLTPGDVPPEMLQKLYCWQAEAVNAIRAQINVSEDAADSEHPEI